jgi:hypothetical protein
MTTPARPCGDSPVAGLVPATHAFQLRAHLETSMAGTNPAMGILL